MSKPSKEEARDPKTPRKKCSANYSIVFRYKEIGDILCGKHRIKHMFLSKYSLDGTQYHCFAVAYTIYPRFLDSGVPVLWFAEHYFLRISPKIADGLGIIFPGSRYVPV
jgi:hypothetical protein